MINSSKISPGCCISSVAVIEFGALLVLHRHCWSTMDHRNSSSASQDSSFTFKITSALKQLVAIHGVSKSRT